MSAPTKRTRFNSTAISPDDDTKITPMKAGKKSLAGAVESLQSQVAAILTKLGSSVLACHHKQYIKERQACKLEDDDEFIPISARVKFELKSSKKVE